MKCLVYEAIHTSLAYCLFAAGKAERVHSQSTADRASKLDGNIILRKRAAFRSILWLLVPRETTNLISSAWAGVIAAAAILIDRVAAFCWTDRRYSLCHSRRVSESLGFQRSVKPSFAHGSAADYVEEAMIVNQIGICSIFGEVVWFSPWVWMALTLPSLASM